MTFIFIHECFIQTKHTKKEQEQTNKKQKQKQNKNKNKNKISIKSKCLIALEVICQIILN